MALLGERVPGAEGAPSGASWIEYMPMTRSSARRTLSSERLAAVPTRSYASSIRALESGESSATWTPSSVPVERARLPSTLGRGQGLPRGDRGVRGEARPGVHRQLIRPPSALDRPSASRRIAGRPPRRSDRTGGRCAARRRRSGGETSSGWSVLGHVPSPPLPKRHQHRIEVEAFVGKPVALAGRIASLYGWRRRIPPRRQACRAVAGGRGAGAAPSVPRLAWKSS